MTRGLLVRYWLKFEPPMEQSKAGFGVTAYSLDDALSLIGSALQTKELPNLGEVSQDIRLDDLDGDHVIPNMHPFTERGVWYPKLAAYR